MRIFDPFLWQIFRLQFQSYCSHRRASIVKESRVVFFIRTISNHDKAPWVVWEADACLARIWSFLDSLSDPRPYRTPGCNIGTKTRHFSTPGIKTSAQTAPRPKFTWRSPCELLGEAQVCHPCKMTSCLGSFFSGLPRTMLTGSQTLTLSISNTFNSHQTLTKNGRKQVQKKY